jgi:hypothetical protein
MSWYAVSNLRDGLGFSSRAIRDRAEVSEGEVPVQAEYLDGLVNPVWDAGLYRPVSLAEWRARREDDPQGPGLEGRVLGSTLQGTLREAANAIGAFGARLTRDVLVPSDEWTKIPFDEVLWDTGGLFDPRYGAFVVDHDMFCSFMAGVRFLIIARVGLVRLDLAIYKNGAPEVVDEGEGSSVTQERHMTAPTVRGRSFQRPALRATTGDVFEVYVRHDVGDETPLSIKDPSLPDQRELEAPTANFVMGMYQK